MNKDLELWQFVAKHLQLAQVVTLFVVAKSSGSSPGRVGFKMAISGDEMCGSIGGGVMEVSLVELAKVKSKKAEGKNNTELIEQVHKKNVPNSSGMICSGKQTVILLELGKRDLKTVESITKIVQDNQQGLLEITERGLRFVIFQEVEFNPYWNSFKGKATFITTFQDWGYTEKIGCKPNLYIIGGGHCALALSELMSKMDFYITVFDDRPNLNTLEKNKFANCVEIIESYEKIGEFIKSDANAYVVVMTLGYKFDEIVIRQLFDKDFKYFGVLGSKAKMKILLKSLEKEGFNKQRLAKIRTPIGLPINSQTPEEIAVSIAAEIIAVKNRNML